MGLLSLEGLFTEVLGEELQLLPQKAIYWPKNKCLLIADLHLGKGNHFRKNGIAIPSSSQRSNWEKLRELFQIPELKRVIFLGDLFHSVYNEDCLVFEELVDEFPEVEFELVVGNHDILDQEIYKKMGLVIHQEKLEIPPFTLSHEPLETSLESYNLAGHIHPGVRLKGKGRQSHRAACFYFGKNNGLLPAFGSLTGLHTLKVKKQDTVYILIEDKVVPI